MDGALSRVPVVSSGHPARVLLIYLQSYRHTLSHCRNTWKEMGSSLTLLPLGTRAEKLGIFSLIWSAVQSCHVGHLVWSVASLPASLQPLFPACTWQLPGTWSLLCVSPHANSALVAQIITFHTVQSVWWLLLSWVKRSSLVILRVKLQQVRGGLAYTGIYKRVQGSLCWVVPGTPRILYWKYRCVNKDGSWREALAFRSQTFLLSLIPSRESHMGTEKKG